MPHSRIVYHMTLCFKEGYVATWYFHQKCVIATITNYEIKPCVWKFGLYLADYYLTVLNLDLFLLLYYQCLSLLSLDLQGKEAGKIIHVVLASNYAGRYTLLSTSIVDCCLLIRGAISMFAVLRYKKIKLFKLPSKYWCL